MKKRIVIACGGTGGHFYPGYALGRALKENGYEPLFMLRKNDPSLKKLESDGMAAAEVDLIGFPRKMGWGTVSFFLKLLRGLWLMRNILMAFRPCAMVGMGGYLSAPALWASRWLGIPSLLHESNTVLGLANCLSLPFCSRAALGLPLLKPTRFQAYEKPLVLTGTPIRTSLYQPTDPERAREHFGFKTGKPSILIFGGSQGAKTINFQVPSALAGLARAHPGQLQVLHLTGKKAPGEELQIREAYHGAALTSVLLPFLEEMHLAYAACDLVLCRAGAGTVAELIALKKPALLIPYPHSTADHQILNAQLLQNSGAALVLEEKDLTPSALAGCLEDLLFSNYTGKLREMSQRYSRLDVPKPEDALVSLLGLVEQIRRK